MVGVMTVLPHIKSGKTKALAVTGAKRSQVAPELPTVSEAGVPVLNSTCGTAFS